MIALLFIALLAAALPSPPSSVVGLGLVVDHLPKTGPAAHAGLQPGDVLVGWSRRDADGHVAASGTFASPFDLYEVEVEQAPRSAIDVTGTRDGAQTTWVLPPSSREIDAHPLLAPDALALHQDADRLMTDGRRAEAAEKWKSLATLCPEPVIRAWALLLAGKASSANRDWTAADEAFGQAVDLLKAADRKRATAETLRVWGNGWRSRGDLVGAANAFRNAMSHQEHDSLGWALACADLAWVVDSIGNTVEGRELRASAAAIVEVVAPSSIDLGEIFYSAGVSSWGHPEEAVAAFRRAVGILERVAPEEPTYLWSLFGLGDRLSELGHAPDGESYIQRGIAIAKGSDPRSVLVASGLVALATLLTREGDHAEGEEYARQAYAIAAAANIKGLTAARALYALSEALIERGDLAGAEDAAHSCLDIAAGLSRAGHVAAGALDVLSQVARQRRDLRGAIDYCKRAIGAVSRLEPDGVSLAEHLQRCSTNALENGNLEQAAGMAKQAVEIAKAHAADGDVAVEAHYGLGLVQRLQGRLDLARQSQEEAIAIRAKMSPIGMDFVRSLNALAALDLDEKDWTKAEDHLTQSLAMVRKVAPGSFYEAQAVHDLGRVYHETGRQPAAITALCGALDTLDFQRSRLGGGDEAAMEFTAKYADYDHDCIAALVDAQRPADALQALERSRGRSLLKMLAERAVSFDKDLPADLVRERNEADGEYNRVQYALGAAHDADEAAKLTNRLYELREKQNAVAQRIRDASPRLAALKSFEPLDLGGVQAALDPGALLVEFSVGPERTFVFAADASGLTVKTIAVGRQELKTKVEAFRQAVETRQRDAARRDGVELYRLLLSPVEERVTASRRILLSPDGPLHALPFAALVGGAPERYLALRKPLAVVASATVFREMAHGRHARDESARVVAFADPEYPKIDAAKAETLGNLELRSALAAGRTLGRLPGTRVEAEAIGRLYADRADLYLGADAREERAKALGSRVGIVHFACHALLDERFPMNSALALTVPENPREGEENGLLQAWEIFESVRLHADLVTLSACGTGLGKDMGGEGLLGLSRAFQYAGARTVLASLWSVGDRSTAPLMERFYAGLRRGLPKDEALRAAQIAMLESRYADPFFWAAFQLNGDWQ